MAEDKKKESWRACILRLLRELDGEVAVDSLHEGAEGEADLDEAMEAAEGLEREGVLWDDHGVLKVRAGVDLEKVS